jgi:hypothetical protein
MAGGTGSSDSLKFKDAYFTHPDDVKWCLDQLRHIYGLDGKTALEPAAGSNVFVKAAPEVSWTTNELFPEFSNGTIHDHHLDYSKDDLSPLGRFDFVIGNPPYGRNSMLARKFVLRSLEISNVVAMVLPKGLRRHTIWDKYFPDDCKVVFEEPLPNSTFDLPDGSVKSVGTFFLILERVPGYSRGKLLDTEPKGYESLETWNTKAQLIAGAWPEWATHGICQWGSSGKFIDRSHRGFARTIWLKLSDEQAQVVSDIDFEPLVERTKTSVPMLTRPEILTEINRAIANG